MKIRRTKCNEKADSFAEFLTIELTMSLVWLFTPSIQSIFCW